MLKAMEIIKLEKSQGALVVELFDKYRVFYKEKSDIGLAKRFIQSRLENCESVIFVAVPDDKPQPIGFTQLYPKYSSRRAVKNWILNDLYVDEDYRGQGIGEQLIKTAIDFAAKDNSTFVELSTDIDNHIAQSLYERVGFERQEPETTFYTYRKDIVKTV